MANSNVTSLQVVGKTGVGKSSTCNSILGREEFKTEDSTTSVTQRCQSAYAEQQGRRVKVVDIPGLHDAELSPEEDKQRIIEKASDAVAEDPDGIDAILMVVPFGRLTHEDKLTFDCVKEIYGENSLKYHGIVVVTFGDLFVRRARNGQSFKIWCSQQKGFFKELFQEVNRRVVLFQNESDDQDVRRQQLEELFKMVEKVKRDHKYTPRLFELAAEERQRLGMAPITQATEAEIDVHYQQLRRLANGRSARDVARLRELQTKVVRLTTQIQNEDNGRGILSNVLKTLERLQTAIEATIQAVDAGIEATQLADERRAEAERSYQELIDEQNRFKERLKHILIGVAIGVGIAIAIGSIVYVAVYGVPLVVTEAAKAVATHVSQNLETIEAAGEAVVNNTKGLIAAAICALGFRFQ